MEEKKKVDWDRRPPAAMTDGAKRAAMEEALALAKEAAAAGEVPVGAVVVCDGVIVGRGRNRREEAKNALCHAEMEAIDQACRTLGGWRLHRCSLFVTLEPCPMCAGAARNARIPSIIYGAKDPRRGAVDKSSDLRERECGPAPTVEEGLLGEESAALLASFFKSLRK